jgi:KaiC/GvpD/RAD55 family RecA-like ATPase
VNTTRLMGMDEATAGPGPEKAPTGIPRLGQITGDRLPRGPVPLVAGGAAAGTALPGLEFLVSGADRLLAGLQVRVPGKVPA